LDHVKKPVVAPRSLARRFSPYLLSVTLALVEASGCAVPRGDLGMSFNEKGISAIKKGSATQADVVRLLGAPDRLVETHDELIADYVYSDGKDFRINFGWPLGFISPVSYAPHDLALSGEGIGIQTFQVAFDSREVVQYADFRRGEAASQYQLSPFESRSP